MLETSLINEISKEFLKLSPTEKSLVMSYINQLLQNNVSKKMIIQINAIHEKYEDFHVGCAPRTN